MTGKRAENSMEIRAFMKARSLLGLMPVDIHSEVCDIYGEGQMPHRVDKFKAGQLDLKKASRSGRPPTNTRVHGILRKHLKHRKTNARCLPH